MAKDPANAVKERIFRETPLFIMKATYGHLWYRLYNCKDCGFWIGRCTQGKLNKTASTIACEFFKRKQS